MRDTTRPYVESPFSIVAVDKFIQATRDSGYKSTDSALSELVDNSVQAGARRIQIRILRLATDAEHPLLVRVLDDGGGMTPDVLRTAMRFGGSSRFGDRGGLGRFGMGLPNASLSQARRVDVFSWTETSPTHRTWLDVDRIASGEISEVPLPTPSSLPGDEALPSPQGTLVCWSICDRLDNKRVSTIERKIIEGLGRKFRYFLWDGGEILVNDRPIVPIDPLYLHPEGLHTGAELYGEPLTYEFAVPAGVADGAGESGFVRVTFSELPIAEWQALSNEDKRSLGISKGAGVSIVRGGREVDHGWFLMGSKRKENYDDWWRCEICFEPVLDELFGITHTKQQIKPSEALVQGLGPDLEQLARVLNKRARQAHLEAKLAPKPTPAETTATAKERGLQPLPPPKDPPSEQQLQRLAKRDRRLQTPPSPDADGTEYHIVPATQTDASFFSVVHQEGRLVVAVNPEHPFYRELYRPLQESDSKSDRALLTKLELVLLAAGRAEAALEDELGPSARKLRREWSDVLATFLGK